MPKLENLFKKIKNILPGFNPKDSHVSTIEKYRQMYNCVVDGQATVFIPKPSSAEQLTVSYETKKRAKYLCYPQRTVAKKWAGLTIGEQAELKTEDKRSDVSYEALKQVYENNGVWAWLEKEEQDVFGVGSKVLLVGYNNGLIFSGVFSNKVFPLTIENGVMTEGAFLESRFLGGKTYTLVSIHTKIKKENIQADGINRPMSISSGGGYNVKNFVFDDKENLVPVTEVGMSSEMADYNVASRLFCTLNNFNRNVEELDSVDNCFSAPVYIDSVDTIRDIEDLFDKKHLELDTGNRILFVSKNKTPECLYKNLENIIVVGGDSSIDGKDTPIYEFAPTMRLEMFANELQAAFNRLSLQVGLGSNDFMWGKSNVATATQVISDNNEKFVNLKKHASVQKCEIIAFNQAILSLLNFAEKKDYDTSAIVFIKTQDSVIVDDETLATNALAQVNSGVMSKSYYLEHIRGLSGKELTAEEEALRLDSALPTIDVETPETPLNAGPGEAE